MDFATLLPRSTDFDAYSLFFTPAYRDGGERLLILSRWRRCCGTGARPTAGRTT
ncbi:MAG: hypothetical protein U0R70_13330 [Solirubrobacteraceae bacterium]